MASGRVRFFPEDVFFVEWMYLHDSLAVTGPVTHGGIGFTLGPVGKMRVGLGFMAHGGVSVYLKPDFNFIEIGDHRVVVSPELYLWDGSTEKTATGGLVISVGIPLD